MTKHKNQQKIQTFWIRNVYIFLHLHEGPRSFTRKIQSSIENMKLLNIKLKFFTSLCGLFRPSRISGSRIRIRILRPTWIQIQAISRQASTVPPWLIFNVESNLAKQRFMYKLYRHKLYRHNLYRHKLYRHKLYREQIVSGTNCIGNILYREQIVSGTNCIGSLSFFYPFILFLMHRIPNHKKILIVNNRHWGFLQ
jgi:hypothetical protein